MAPVEKLTDRHVYWLGTLTMLLIGGALFIATIDTFPMVIFSLIMLFVAGMKLHAFLHAVYWRRRQCDLCNWTTTGRTHMYEFPISIGMLMAVGIGTAWFFTTHYATFGIVYLIACGSIFHIIAHAWKWRNRECHLCNRRPADP